MAKMDDKALPTGRRPTVLIVDDDPVFSMLAAETLSVAGYAAPVANSAGAAWTLLHSECPDLILMDVEMPGSSGFDLCAQIRATPLGANVPIIMVTGHNDTESVARSYEAGATDFINKPVLWATLPHRIGFMLRASDNMRALTSSEAKNRALLQTLPDSIYIVSRDGSIRERISGDPATVDALSAGSRLDHIIPLDVARAVRESMATVADPTELITHDFETGEGEGWHAFEARLRLQVDGTYLMVIRDSTERRRANARIEQLAYYDPLTGLPNRQLFVREVTRVIAAGASQHYSSALLYLDLDRFKRVNDNFGHSVGDALLRSVARRLEKCVRLSDTRSSDDAFGARGSGIIARLGGDEFAILLAGIGDETQAKSVAHRIQQTLSEPFDCEGQQLVITPSIGIALHPRDAHDVEDLLVNADMAMYEAKDQGRNTYAFYGESLSLRSLGRLTLESDLRRALDTQEFQLHYQPKLDLGSGRIIGVEALIRWPHAERGWVPPDKFIPVAEDSGLIVPIGDWVLRETCRQLKAWRGTPLGSLSVAINVSVKQFGREDFVDSVLRTLWQFGLKGSALELEITESLLMKNIAETTAALKELAAAGITLAIDDFGTGYSSLGYLRQFTVNSLKIDRSFVKDLGKGGDDTAICAAIIAMARELKLKVVAEGVETEAQLAFLRTHSCDQAQGYLISKPVPAAELERWLTDAAGTFGAGLPMDELTRKMPG